ncbi:MAG: hypothetical protein Q9182_002638 [Xanthomendoza sp. 2 TL-2023]
MSRTTSPFYVDSLLSARYLWDARRRLASSVCRRLDHSDGSLIGQLLLVLGIPIRHLDAATSIILHDWRYPEHQDRAWELNQAFRKGRDAAFSLPSQGFRELEVRKEDFHGSEFVASHNRLLQSGSGPDENDSDSHAPPQQSSDGGTGFARFLLELEMASFDTVLATEANDEDSPGLILEDILRDEVYDCLIQNSADYLKGLEGFV